MPVAPRRLCVAMRARHSTLSAAISQFCQRSGAVAIIVALSSQVCTTPERCRRYDSARDHESRRRGYG
jgi:hypothetical protein